FAGGAAGGSAGGRGFFGRPANGGGASSGGRVMNASRPKFSRPEFARPEFSRPEFSRIVPLAQLGSEPFRQEMAATEPEREALARRFDLLGLDRLAAEVELIRQGSSVILLNASLEAAFLQSYAVTLDPVEGSLAVNF